jgi:ferredoxin-NADP reductase
MARPPTVWRLATVLGSVVEAPRARTILLDAPGWTGHVAGQHVDVRLTAADGYRTERSYAIGSAPDDAGLAITIERVDGGEVSPYLADAIRPGDGLEQRGLIGGAFTWSSGDGCPCC